MNEMKKNHLHLFPSCAEDQLRVKEILPLTEEALPFSILSHFLLSDLLNCLSITGFPICDLWKKLWRAF